MEDPYQRENSFSADRKPQLERLDLRFILIYCAALVVAPLAFATVLHENPDIAQALGLWLSR